MKELNEGVYGKPKFGLIVILFGVALIVCMIAVVLFLKSGHPVFHPTPQPKDNKGMLVLPTAPTGLRAEAQLTAAPLA